MNLKSLGLRTDLIFDRFQGEVRDHGDFIAVRTPVHPEYLWGHRLILPSAPTNGDFDRWCALYDHTIGQMGFKVFTWDDVSGYPGDIALFLDAGFKFQRHTVLTATTVITPPHLSDAFTIRPLSVAGDWDQYADVHYFEDPRFTPEELRAFTIGQRDEMRAMVDAGLGRRFGAFQGDRLLAELGIYWDGEIARFNTVATRVEARRQGRLPHTGLSRITLCARKHALQNAGDHRRYRRPRRAGLSGARIQTYRRTLQARGDGS